MAVNQDTGIILLAGGQGTRAGGSTPKQFAVHRSGQTLLALAAKAAYDAQPWAQFIVVAPLDALELTTLILESAGVASAVVVPGGDSRIDSLARGLEALDTTTSPLCVVHDGTRPFTPPELFTEVLELVRSGTADAAWPARIVANSIFEVSEIGYRLRRPRDFLTAATPIASGSELLRKLVSANSNQNAVPSQIFVESGTKWLIVDDSPLNFKVTSPRDLEDAVELDLGYSF